MGDYRVRDWVREIKDAERMNAGSRKLIGIESFLAAIVIGVDQKSLGIGIAAFVVLFLLWYIPIFNGAMAYAFSAGEALFAGGILSKLTNTPAAAVWFIGLLLFLVFRGLHKHFIGASERTMGYSFLLFEGLVIAGGTYSLMYGDAGYTGSKPLYIPLALLLVTVVCAFIPMVRVIEMVLLTGTVTVFTYVIAAEQMPFLWAVAVSAAVMAYLGYSHFMAAAAIDYKGMAEKRKRYKADREAEWEEQTLESVVYAKWPELEKECYYFNMSVCKSEEQRWYFNRDWLDYLASIKESQNPISFNRYFEEEKLYRVRDYNTDFAEQYGKARTGGSRDTQKETLDQDSGETLFIGVSNAQELHKRYKDLLKIYHPDNQAGDTSMTQKIQTAYQNMLEAKGWEK